MWVDNPEIFEEISALEKQSSPARMICALSTLLLFSKSALWINGLVHL